MCVILKENPEDDRYRIYLRYIILLELICRTKNVSNYELKAFFTNLDLQK